MDSTIITQCAKRIYVYFIEQLCFVYSLQREKKPSKTYVSVITSFVVSTLAMARIGLYR